MLRNPGPPALTFTELAGGENYQVTASTTWEDWDIAAIVPAGTQEVLLGILNNTNVSHIYGGRQDGSALVRYFSIGSYGYATLRTKLLARVLELYDGDVSRYGDFNILGYWS